LAFLLLLLLEERWSLTSCHVPSSCSRKPMASTRRANTLHLEIIFSIAVMR
jgi:hypothetical protein